MRFIKFFFEEPAAMELLTPDVNSEARAPTELRSLEEFLSAPAYHRGYFAATDLAEPAVGFSSLPKSIWMPLLKEVVGAGFWYRPEGSEWIIFDDWEAWEPSPGEVIAVGGSNDLPPWSYEQDARRALPAIRATIDAGATVMVAEPAPDGVDWALYGSSPFSGPARAAARSISEARSFVIPFRQARGEHRFYFERYDPRLFAQFEIPRG